MNPLKLIALELRHRPISAALTCLVLSLAVATVQFFTLSARAAENETRMIQRDAGLNLLILPAGTDVDDYWARGYSQYSMDQSVMAELQNQQVANRLVPLLQHRVEVDGVLIMLTGIAPEVFKGGKQMKAVFGLSPQPGSVFVGSGVAAEWMAADSSADHGEQLDQVDQVDQVKILGQQLSVAKVLPPTGTADDMRIYTALSDAQQLLNKPGQINEIQALECHCSDPTEDPIAALRSELEPMLPGALIVRRNDLADARRHQRQLAESILAIAAPIMLMLCGLVVAALAAINLRQRRPEVAVFHAVGFGSGRVATVFLGRILLLAVTAAGIGSLMSWVLLEQTAAELFRMGKQPQTFDSALLIQSLWATPAFAFVAAAIPLALSLTRDPVKDLQPE